jgi:hypothetical protein
MGDGFKRADNRQKFCAYGVTVYGKFVGSVLLGLAVTLPPVPGRPIRFRVLAAGAEPGAADARELVIRDASSLNTNWAELHEKSNQSPGSATAAPKVDFTTHVVVFIRMETQSGTEAGVAVTRVVKGRASAGRNVQTEITVEESRLETG